MIELNKVTLISIDCYNYGAAVASLKKSMEQCKFSRVIFFTDIPLKLDGIEVINIPSITSKPEYSQFVIKELWKYIETDYVLVTQHDGWILNGNSWSDDFFNFDGLGSAWLYTDQRNNFNGGFCLMSKKLITVLGTDDFIKIVSPDDEIIGRLYRNYLIENHGIKFPDDDTCDRFAFELRTPVYDTFGFHSYFHKPYQKTVVVSRKAALGDVVMVEPVMRYFHDKGYRVVLDTLPQFHLLFLNHYFKVHKLQEIDQRLLATAKFVNLDGTYEAEPELNHLEAYFKYTCITDTPLTKPQLTLGFELNKETKLFPKLALIHYDKRGQNSRNIFGIDWDAIAGHLIDLGYTVLQIGKGEHLPIKGARQINITNENFLCYVIGSADIFLGCDSGPSNIAVAFNVPSIIFFGGVDADIVHPDLTNIEVMDNGICCEKPKCWHKSGAGATSGMPCIVNENLPPCVQFSTEKVILAIGNIINKKK